MELTYNLKNKILIIGGIVTAAAAALLLAQLVFAYSTASLLPSSDGAYLQWTPNTGTTHYTMVDESTCNGTTDYNSTNTVGNRDSYGARLAYVPNGSTITAIEITPCASRNQPDGGSATMNVFYRFSGVNSPDAGNYALTDTTTPTQLATTTFSGLSLMKGSASTLQIGAVLSAGTSGARLSRIAVVVTYTPLIAPSSLGATNVSGSQNDLSWTDNSSNEDGFKVESSLNNQFGPFSQIATTSANVVSYSNTRLTADQTYYYRVRAFNSGGNSRYTNTAYAITATVVPRDPTNLTVTASSSAILSWSQSSTNENGFKVERGTDGVNFTEIATKGINVTRHVDPGLAPGTTYYYRVRAFNVIGNSGYSNTASTTTP